MVRRVTDGLDLLAQRVERLSAATRNSAELNQSDRESRDAAIVDADRAGVPLREIVRWSALSLSHVQKICYDAEVRRQSGR